MEDELYSELSTDPVMKELIDRHGEIKIEPTDEIFKRLVVSVIRQQLSMASADAIRERLFDEYRVEPSTIIEVPNEELRDIGLSNPKTRYIKSISEAFIENNYSIDYFNDMADQDVRDELTLITGVGEWTANMFLIFCLGRQDVFPINDLGIRRGMRELYSESMERGDMMDVAEDWRPYRSYGSLYIWRETE